VVAVAVRIEVLGWILSRRFLHDRRRYGLYLTPEGLRQVQVLRRQADEAESFAHDLLSREEFDQLLGLLARLG
jgi:DNA-binding MarR family transcriptional regulator